MAKRKEVHFGQLAIVLGYVTPASVAECLKLQKMLELKGTKKRLGEILVEQQMLTEEEFKNILKRQGIYKLLCPECDNQYFVDDANGQWLFKCEKCMVPLKAVIVKEEKIPEPGEADPLLGRVLGGARVLARLADGYFTRIYRGMEEQKKREVIVRVLKDEYASDEDTAKRFMTRASKAVKVKHGSVAAVYDVRQEHGICFSIEELIEGTTLSRLLSEEKNLPPRQAVRIALQVIQALKSVHGRKLAHGDVSTSNILISRKGRAVLANLSVGPKLLSSEKAFGKASLTSTEFAAPEVVKDASRATPKSDMFSVGAVLYRMLVGDGPFTGESDFEIMLNNLQGKYNKLSDVASSLPKQLTDIVDKILQRNPMMRYDSMADVAAEFEKLDASSLPQARLSVSPEAPAIQKTEEKKASLTPQQKEEEAEKGETYEYHVQEKFSDAETPDLPPPEEDEELPEITEIEEEPLRLAKGESSRSPQVKPDKETPEPEKAQPPVEIMRKPAQEKPQPGKTPAAKRSAPPELPEIPAFLVAEPEEVKLTESEKEKILEEGLREESANLLPPPEVLEAMARSGKKKGKPLPVVIAVVVIVVLIIIFILVMSIPGQEKETGDSAAQKQYDEAVEYAENNPDKFDAQIKKFRAIMSEYPTTRWAMKAKDKVTELQGELEKAEKEKKWAETIKKLNESSGDTAQQIKILQDFINEYPLSPYVQEARRRITSLESEGMEKKAAVYVSQTKKEISRLCDEGKFKESLDLIKRGLPPGLPLNPYHSQLQSLTNDVYAKARESFDRIKKEADRLAQVNKYDDAAALLNSIINEFGIEDFAVRARKIRAEILNAQFEHKELLQAAFYGASEAANELASQGKYQSAVTVLNMFATEYSADTESKNEIALRIIWIEAAQRFLRRAYDQLSASVNDFISLRSSSGIVYQGTLKSFENGMLTIGDLPAISVTELPRSEIINLARKGAGNVKDPVIEEASYHYFTGDTEAARDILKNSSNISVEASALVSELARIEKARRITRHVRLFDTKTLKGWKGDTKTWKAENGILVGTKGQINVTDMPQGSYTLSFHLRLSEGDKGFDILFPAGENTLTWHIGSEKDGYSEIREIQTTRNNTVLLEGVWVRISIIVDDGKAEGKLGEKTIWKLDPIPVVPTAKPAFGFNIESGIFELNRIYLAEGR